PEQIVFNTQEMYGKFYIAVSGHTAQATGAAYTLTAQVAPPVETYSPLTGTAHIAFTAPISDTNIRTLLLYSWKRLPQPHPGDTLLSSGVLTAELNTLAGDPDVRGARVDLDSYPEFTQLYAQWDADSSNPLAANYIASQIKALLYRLAPSYPNLRYL